MLVHARANVNLMTPHADTWGCPACLAEPDAEAAWASHAAARPFDVVATILDESHSSVTLLACRHCGQRCVSVFTEFIDWSGGDDAQYQTLMPLTPDEASRVLAQGDAALATLESLSRDTPRRQLRLDHPTGGPRRCYWSAGPLLIPPGG